MLKIIKLCSRRDDILVEKHLLSVTFQKHSSLNIVSLSSNVIFQLFMFV